MRVTLVVIARGLSICISMISVFFLTLLDVTYMRLVPLTTEYYTLTSHGLSAIRNSDNNQVSVGIPLF